jgi:hypothetical protein
MWEFSTSASGGEPMSRKILRRSKPYLDLAQYLIENPPNERPFSPKDPEVGDAAAAFRAYRVDVERWVMIRMMEKIARNEGADEAVLYDQVIEELHELPWFPGSPWKGFYYLQPAIERIKVGLDRESLAFSILGIKAPVLTAVGLIGFWKEPTYEEVDQWNTRQVLNGMRNAAEGMAEAALTGRSIGQLSQEEMLAIVQATVGTINDALPGSTQGRRTAMPDGSGVEAGKEG